MKYLLVLAFCLFSFTTYAVVETYQFDSEAQQQRYHQFVEELRCPKCQNQNLAGSNSPIAEDLRRELHRLLQEGKTDQQIVEYMVERYGEFILYRPRFNPETALLWMAPGIFLLIGFIGVWVMFGRKRGLLEKSEDKGLSEEERSRLQSLLVTATTDDQASGIQQNAVLDKAGKKNNA